MKKIRDLNLIVNRVHTSDNLLGSDLFHKRPIYLYICKT